MLTPLHLEIVMHYHTRGCDMENLSAPTVREYLSWLRDEGMIELETDASKRRSYRTSEKGRVWLDALLSTPFPVQTWAMPVDPSMRGERG